MNMNILNRVMALRSANLMTFNTLPLLRKFNTFYRSNIESCNNVAGKMLLMPPSSIEIIQSRTMITKGVVRKLCRDCYYVWKQGRQFNYCRTHPSHSQCTREPHKKERMIITHITQGRKRPW